jgi:hypothetical protein
MQHILINFGAGRFCAENMPGNFVMPGTAAFENSDPERVFEIHGKLDAVHGACLPERAVLSLS